jgi:hypothetical protein
MNIRIIMAALVLALVGFVPAAVQAQSCTSTSVTENFTGASTNCTWSYYGGACLTAGSTASTGTSSPGQLPMCKNLPYYGGQTLYGGNTGDATQDTPATGGALRLTNGSNVSGTTAGNNQSGAIVSNVPFALSSAGLQVTFTTETYIGDSGSNSHGGGSDGADGISFFLQDASQPVTLGDYGGSLGYTCSNTNNRRVWKFPGWLLGDHAGHVNHRGQHGVQSKQPGRQPSRQHRERLRQAGQSRRPARSGQRSLELPEHQPRDVALLSVDSDGRPAPEGGSADLRDRFCMGLLRRTFQRSTW